MYLTAQQERRLREIIRAMRTRAGTFAFAYWFAPEPAPSKAGQFFFIGGKGKPKQAYHTYGKSTRRNSRLLAECPADASDADTYATLAAAIESHT